MRILRIIRISRPVFWIVGPLLFLAPFALSGTFPSFIAFAQMAMLTFPYCFFLFGINDMYDYESDRINRRKGCIHGAVLSRSEFRQVRLLSAAMAALMLASSLITFSITNTALVLVLILLSYLYSARPVRLKELAPLDSISNAAIVYIIVAMGQSHISPSIILPYRNVWPLMLALLSVHIFSTVPDCSADRRAGTRTFASLFGARPASLASLAIMSLAMLMLDTRRLPILAFLSASIVIYAAGFALNDERAAQALAAAQYIIFIACALWFLVSALAG